MAEFLRVFEAKALALALTDAGYSVSERTVQRWKAGETKPKPQDIRAIRGLVGALGTEEEAPRPGWAEGLADEVARAVVTLLSGPESPLVSQLADSLERLGLLPFEEPSEESVRTPGGSGTGPSLSVRRASKR